MDLLLDALTPGQLALAFAIAMFAGLIKGMVGFALPTLMITGLSMIMDPRLALAGLILPALVTNGMQALRHGPAAAWDAVRQFWLFVVVLMATLVVGAGMVAVLSYQTLFVMIGAAVTFFAVIQLFGGGFGWLVRRPRLATLGFGSIAGFVGGFSGIWGPPTVIYLTLLNTEKDLQMRVQGVIYGGGALMLALAHLQTGVLRRETAALSALLLIPAILGMVMGTRVQNRIDQRRFRTLTLVILGLGGLNLIRRGLTGGI